jgi:hypothetical protein
VPSWGRFGETRTLERLTMCLIKLGRVTEAVEVSTACFWRHKRDLETQFSERVKARIDKALAATTPNTSGVRYLLFFLLFFLFAGRR